MTNHRAIMAARNSADWYSMMFDIHGLRYHRSEIAVLGTDSPPRYHSWMTTLDPEARADLLLLITQNAYRPKYGVKDAFDCLDLFNENFIEHFSATWIFAETIQPADTARWARITSVNDLSLWETAWKQGGSSSDQLQFPNAILDRSDVVIWGRRQLKGFDAGVIANFSKDCVGLSNCFGHGAFPAAATLCAELSQGALLGRLESGKVTQNLFLTTRSQRVSCLSGKLILIERFIKSLWHRVRRPGGVLA